MESNAEAKEKAKKEVFEDEKEDEEDGGGAATEDEKKKRVTAMATAASASLKKGGMNHLQAPSCQAEKCAVDLTDAKRYHRRHKVCEQHSKAPVVIVAGLRQRFCQQCSRSNLCLLFFQFSLYSSLLSPLSFLLCILFV